MRPTCMLHVVRIAACCEQCGSHNLGRGVCINQFRTHHCILACLTSGRRLLPAGNSELPIVQLQQLAAPPPLLQPDSTLSRLLPNLCAGLHPSRSPRPRVCTPAPFLPLAHQPCPHPSSPRSNNFWMLWNIAFASDASDELDASDVSGVKVPGGLASRAKTMFAGALIGAIADYVLLLLVGVHDEAATYT